MNYFMLLAAVLLICAAHYVRMIRWQLFIRIYEKPWKRNLIQALSVGYLLNYIFPYKAGDLLRAWISGRKMKNGKPLGLSTVIMDRYLDVMAVGIIFAILSWQDMENTVIRETAAFYIITTIVLLAATAMLYLLRGWMKRFLRLVAGIFNERIESALLCFSWALIWNFKDMLLRINKFILLVSTVGMWGLYLSSYYFFAEFLNRYWKSGNTWVDVFLMLFTQNGIKESTSGAAVLRFTKLQGFPGYMLIYMVSPLVFMLFLSLFMEKGNKKKENKMEYLNLIPHLNPADRLDFLEQYFSNEDRGYVINYLKINQDVSVIRDYSAGSNAATLLCMDSEKTFFRKYAFGDEGEKLWQQIVWLQKYQEVLPLPEIIRQEKQERYCYYDMPYQSSAVGLFEYIHSMPLEKSWAILERVLKKLEGSVYRMDRRKADQGNVHAYIESKVKKNLEKIRNAKQIRPLQIYESIVINGVTYRNLSGYESYLSETCLQEIFGEDFYSVIHGDLTIENIICCRDENGYDDFYMIDPNTGNVHDSPNLDYGKLLQSLHGGYEFLMKAKNVEVNENQINFLFTKSAAYTKLHEKLQEYMEKNFDRKRIRSIYFHEIVHWLRLMPYKTEKDGKRAVLFYAGLLMVMNDVMEMYGGEQDETAACNF